MPPSDDQWLNVIHVHVYTCTQFGIKEGERERESERERERERENKMTILVHILTAQVSQCPTYMIVAFCVYIPHVHVYT